MKSSGSPQPRRNRSGRSPERASVRKSIVEGPKCRHASSPLPPANKVSPNTVATTILPVRFARLRSARLKSACVRSAWLSCALRRSIRTPLFSRRHLFHAATPSLSFAKCSGFARRVCLSQNGIRSRLAAAQSDSSPTSPRHEKRGLRPLANLHRQRRDARPDAGRRRTDGFAGLWTALTIAPIGGHVVPAAGEAGKPQADVEAEGRTDAGR